MTSRTELDPWFHPTSIGFTGIVRDPPPATWLRSFDRSSRWWSSALR